MDNNKKKSEDLQNRREFFKKASRKVLPIFASFTFLSSVIPFRSEAKEQFNCGWSCVMSCLGSCLNGCYTSCVNYCAMGCNNSCRGGCNEMCAVGCSSCVAECRIGCGNGCSGTCIANCSSYSEHVPY